jgi:MYXO-CTERM domain-containing protein
MKSNRIRRAAVVSPIVLAALFTGAAVWVPSSASAAAAVAPGSPSTAMVQLTGSLHPLARPGAEVGRMDPGVRLTLSLLLQMSPAQKAASARILADLQDAGSPMYHRWLTPEDYAARFGASKPDLARATEWLQSQGLSVEGPSRMATRLSFSGTVGQIEQAFATELHHYAGDDGKTHFAMSRAPSVPADLGSVVLGLHGAHDFRAKAPDHPRLGPVTATGPLYSLSLPTTECTQLPFCTVDGGTGNIPAFAPADFAKVYDVAPLYAAGITGMGQQIAIAGETDVNDADIAAFRSQFTLPANPFTRVLVPGSGTAAVSNDGDLGESELDLEWSGAVAPDATIDFVFTGNNENFDVFDSMIYAIEQRTAPVLSVSYGEQCETALPPSDAVFYEAVGDAAAMVGMTVLVAAGDSGAAGCDSGRGAGARNGEFVELPASIPSVVAVGGTQFNLTVADLTTYLDPSWNALGYIPESGWNDTQIDEEAGFSGFGGGTGGRSVLYGKPYWQVPFTPQDNARDLPDIALNASDVFFPYVVSYSWTAADGTSMMPQPEALTAVGGTSCAAPSFAGILALVNQSLAMQNPSAPVGLGNANPMLYALANNPTTANAFHDVTMGSNVVPCLQGSISCPTSPPYQFGYDAGPGYDLATGLGSIDAANLVAAFKLLTPTSTALVASEMGTTEGSPIQLTATISSQATSTPLTGSVTFYYETFDDEGGIDLGGTLGTATIMATSTGTEGATATLTAKAPGGYTGAGKIAAFYGGDIHYLSSWSTLSAIKGTSSIQVCPTEVTILPLQTGLTITTSGGAPPVSLSIVSDSTCMREKLPDGGRLELCSTLSDAGVFTAGPTTGQAIVAAIDQYSAYAYSTINVAGSADAGTPLPVTSCNGDAGLDAGGASDATVITDAQTGDSGGGAEPSSSKGCSCETAGIEHAEGGAWLGVGLLGLVGFARRRRSRT